MQLHKEVKLAEGVPVVFVGTHIVNWKQEYGVPQIGFVEEDVPIHQINALVSMLESVVNAMNDAMISVTLDDNPDYVDVVKWIKEFKSQISVYDEDALVPHMKECKGDHDECRGDLWECSECHSSFCWEEGSTDGIDICNSCWLLKMNPEIVGEQ